MTKKIPDFIHITCASYHQFLSSFFKAKLLKRAVFLSPTLSSYTMSLNKGDKKILKNKYNK